MTFAKLAFLVFVSWMLFEGPVLVASGGRFERLLNKPYKEKYRDIHEFYKQAFTDRPDSADFYQLTGRLREAARKAADREGMLEADLAEALFDVRSSSHPPEKMRQLIERSTGAGVMHIAYRAVYVMTLYHWREQQYDQAFHWYNVLDSMLREVSVADFPNKVEYLLEIGKAHYTFGDYPEAIRYYSEATADAIDPFYEGFWKHAMNNMGLAWQKLDSLDRADSCFFRVLSVNVENKEVWEGIVAGNLGYNEYLRGNDKEAIPLLQKDIVIARKYGDWGLAAGSSISMADILIRRGAMSGAKVQIDSAAVYIRRSGQQERWRMLYPVMGKWHAMVGDPVEASRFMDSALSTNNRYHQQFSALKLLRVTQERLASQRETALKELQSSNERLLYRRNLLLAFIGILGLGTIFLGYRRRKQQEIRIRDNELTLLQTRQELQDARAELENLARQAVDNSELVEALTRQPVLTEDGWRRFTTLFDKLHPHFRKSLKEQFPLLTPAELRYLAMEKLRFGNKEMAALQGISTNAVMVTKHRVRKKLKLPEKQDIQMFIVDIA